MSPDHFSEPYDLRFNWHRIIDDDAPPTNSMTAFKIDILKSMRMASTLFHLRLIEKLSIRLLLNREHDHFRISLPSM